jgi:hypothetical protein
MQIGYRTIFKTIQKLRYASRWNSHSHQRINQVIYIPTSFEVCFPPRIILFDLFLVIEPDTPDKVHLKVGRSVGFVKRIDQWGRQCRSKEPVLRGWWPNTQADASLLKGRVKAGEKGMWCHRLEQLIHLELADLVVRGVYLESDFRVRRGCGGTSTPATASLSAGRTPKKLSVGSPRRIQKKARTPCVDCESGFTWILCLGVC